MLNKLSLAAAIVVGALLHFSAAIAQTAPQGMMAGDAVQVKATVEAIDKATRAVTLKGERGRVVSVQVDPEVKAFDTLKVGDTVTATYMVAVAAQIAKPGQPMAEPKAGVATPKDGKPGEVVAGQQVRTRVKIDAVDAASNTVTFRGEKGVRTVAVKNPDLQKSLKELKAGDEVDLIYTEALAITIDPAK